MENKSLQLSNCPWHLWPFVLC